MLVSFLLFNASILPEEDISGTGLQQWTSRRCRAYRRYCVLRYVLHSLVSVDLHLCPTMFAWRIYHHHERTPGGSSREGAFTSVVSKFWAAVIHGKHKMSKYNNTGEVLKMDTFSYRLDWECRHLSLSLSLSLSCSIFLPPCCKQLTSVLLFGRHVWTLKNSLSELCERVSCHKSKTQTDPGTGS